MFVRDLASLGTGDRAETEVDRHSPSRSPSRSPPQQQQQLFFHHELSKSLRKYSAGDTHLISSEKTDVIEEVRDSMDLLSLTTTFIYLCLSLRIL